MSIPRMGCATAMVLILTAWPVNAAVLYCHDFTSLDKIASSGLSLSVGPAPGGKAGTALKLSNATNASGATAAITPGVSLPNSVSVVFRLYVDSYTGSFMAVYNHAPGEGVRLLVTVHAP